MKSFPATSWPRSNLTPFISLILEGIDASRKCIKVRNYHSLSDSILLSIWVDIFLVICVFAFVNSRLAPVPFAPPDQQRKLDQRNYYLGSDFLRPGRWIIGRGINLLSTTSIYNEWREKNIYSVENEDEEEKFPGYTASMERKLESSCWGSSGHLSFEDGAKLMFSAYWLDLNASGTNEGYCTKQ